MGLQAGDDVVGQNRCGGAGGNRFQAPRPQPIDDIERDHAWGREQRNDSPPAGNCCDPGIFAEIFVDAVAAEMTADALVKEHHDGAEMLGEHNLSRRRFDTAALTDHGTFSSRREPGFPRRTPTWFEYSRFSIFSATTGRSADHRRHSRRARTVVEQSGVVDFAMDRIAPPPSPATA